MKYLFAIFTLSLLIFSCDEKETQQFEYSGGSVAMALDNEPTTYIPRKVLDYYSSTVLTQINEGLVGIDPKTTKIVPKLALSWTKSDNGKVYVFTLRDDVYFHPHDAFKSKADRLMTAEDVLMSIEMGCAVGQDGEDPATYSFLLKGTVMGAEEYHAGSAKSISGVTIDGNTVRIELLHEDHNFLNKLANVNAAIGSITIIEGGHETDVIGTGPFKYSDYVQGEHTSLTLTKNEDYYLKDDAGNALPYLDSLVFFFQSRKLEQLEMFEQGKTDLIIGLPTSRITRMLEGRIEDFNSKPPKLILANNPLLESNYYYFNLADERFKDPRVRKAFNYAVNKKALGQDILRNQYYDLGDYGITPPISRAMKGYDFTSIKEAGYNYDPEKAKQLLAEAGYPEGEGFGSVELRFNINETHSAIADEFAKQIYRVLGINVNIDGSSFSQLTEDGATGKGDIFRSGWSADYPSPETFLMNFYGGYLPEDSTEASHINKARYRNPVFDQFYKKAIESKKMTDQMKYFSKAEIALLEDPPLIPLWYTGDIEITYSYLRNFHFNSLNLFNFTEVYIKEWTAEEYQEELNATK
ncbi:MAG: oligopeptide transport system substrate-binding protein [Flavobacteriaceae bacterium]|jgi:oligopeptide transport system substrate-binding protein